MPFSSEPIISLKNVFLNYDNRSILENVNFEIGKGEFVYLIGKTGAGKSTLLKLLYADVKPVSGEASVAHFNVSSLRRKEIPFLRRKLGIVFQDFQLLTDRSVSANIEFALRASGWGDSTQIKSKITDVLLKVGLTSKINFMPHELSGGEQQRVVIARSLINDPHVILADEPTGNLDPEVSQEIMQLLFKINAGGTAVVMATHNYSLLKQFPARTLECKDRMVQEFSGVTTTLPS